MQGTGWYSPENTVKHQFGSEADHRARLIELVGPVLFSLEGGASVGSYGFGLLYIIRNGYKVIIRKRSRNTVLYDRKGV